MKKISFNHGTIGFQKNQAYFELPRSEIYLNSVDEIQEIHRVEKFAFPCSLKLKEDHLLMTFQIEQGFVPFLQLRKESTSLQLDASEYVIGLGYFFTRQKKLVTLFEPNNLFINEKGKLKILYRGVRGLMPAEGFDAEPILDQVKRLLLLLFTSARFDELRIHGLEFAKTKTKAGQKRIVQRILQAEEFRDLLTAIKAERVDRETEEEDKEPSKVKVSHRPSFLKNQKVLLVGVGVAWIFTFIIAYVLGASQTTSVEDGPEIDPKFLKGLKYASLQQFEEAAKEFDTLEFQKFGKTDQHIMLLTYLYSGQPQKVLTLDPSFAEAIAHYYSQVDKPEELAKIKSKHPAILFEQAYSKKNYQQLIQLQNKVTLDQRRRKIVLQAYLQMGNVDQAKQFANQFNDPTLAKMLNESNQK